MKGADVIDSLKRRFKVDTDVDLGKRIGLSVPAIQNWKNRPSVTARQASGIVSAAHKSGERHVQESAIRPIAEFFQIQKVRTKSNGSYSVFVENNADGRPHPYLSGLKNELCLQHGLYIFFDSRGQAIYAGKAKNQFLWKEMNLAFNRQRGNMQKIRRVNHSARMQIFRTTDEIARQIVEIEVPLHELAKYFSAYRVADEMINMLEAMLVRSFANNLLNKRMEQF